MPAASLLKTCAWESARKQLTKMGRHHHHHNHHLRRNAKNGLASALSSVVVRVLMLPPLVLLLLICFWATSTLLPVSVLHICVSGTHSNVYCMSAGTSKVPHNPSHTLSAFLSQHPHTNGSLGTDAALSLSSDTDTSSSLVQDRSLSPPPPVPRINESVNHNQTIGTVMMDPSPASPQAQQLQSNFSKGERSQDLTPTIEREAPAVETPTISGQQGILPGSINQASETKPASFLNSQSTVALGAVKAQIDKIRANTLPLGKKPHSSSCDGRRIYVYNLPAKFNGDLTRECRQMLPWSDMCRYFSNGGMGEPIKAFHDGWYKTHQYSLELIFHSRLLRYPCLTMDADQANLFYIPFYAGLDILRWHFRANATHEQRDRLGYELVWWLKNQKHWHRRGARDHVLVLGKVTWDFHRVRNEDRWGNNLLRLPEMQNPLKLLIERQPWQPNEIAVPHPTFFHPRSDSDIHAWQTALRNSQRRFLVGFAGAPRPGSKGSIRSELISQCEGAKEEFCKFLNCNGGTCLEPQNTIKLFMSSDFCLQPPGDSPTRRSVFDSLVAGCIPVLFDPFTAYYQYAWHLPANESAYSVFVPKESVKSGGANVIEILRTVGNDRRAEMRRHIIEVIMPGIVYGDPDAVFEEFQDAFQVSINNLLWRVRNSVSTDELT